MNESDKEAEERRSDPETVSIEFGVSDDFTEWTLFVFCGAPLETKEFCNALRKFADSYENGEIVSPAASGSEESSSLQ